MTLITLRKHIEALNNVSQQDHQNDRTIVEMAWGQFKNQQFLNLHKRSILKRPKTY